MTTYLGKSCSFGLPRVPFVNCCQFMYLVISLLVLRAGCGILIVSVPDHCLSFYFDPNYTAGQQLTDHNIHTALFYYFSVELLHSHILKRDVREVPQKTGLPMAPRRRKTHQTYTINMTKKPMSPALSEYHARWFNTGSGRNACLSDMPS